jgi:hypothetical protein
VHGAKVKTRPYRINVTMDYGKKTAKKVVWWGGVTPGSRVKGVANWAAKCI